MTQETPTASSTPTCGGTKANGQPCTRRVPADGDTCWQHATAAPTVEDAPVVDEHAHTWHPVTGACTHPGCTRQKPAWLIDAEANAYSTKESKSGWRGIWTALPSPVRGLIIAAILGFIANMVMQGITDNVGGTGTGSTTDQVVVSVH